MLTELTGLSALTIGVILLSISAAYVIGFCTGYQLGTRDTEQEFREGSVWKETCPGDGDQ